MLLLLLLLLILLLQWLLQLLVLESLRAEGDCLVGCRGLGGGGWGCVRCAGGDTGICRRGKSTGVWWVRCARGRRGGFVRLVLLVSSPWSLPW